MDRSRVIRACNELSEELAGTQYEGVPDPELLKALGGLEALIKQASIWFNDPKQKSSSPSEGGASSVKATTIKCPSCKYIFFEIG